MLASNRQLRIMGLAAAGKSDKQIAAALGVSLSTVRTHWRRIYLMNGFTSRTHAVAAYVIDRALQGQQEQAENGPKGDSGANHIRDRA